MVNVSSSHVKVMFKMASILQLLGLLQALVITLVYYYYCFIIVYRVNESGKDSGFGQSILHESQLIFHTPPYNIGSGVVIHDHPVPQWPNIRHVNKVNVN